MNSISGSASKSGRAFIGLSFFRLVVFMLLALVIMVVIEFTPLTNHFLRDNTLYSVASGRLGLWFSQVLRSSLTGEVVIIVLWALMGIGVYLAASWLYNALVGARNRVVFFVFYANKGKNSFKPAQAMGAVTILLLVLAVLASFPYGLSLWLGLWNPLLTTALSWPNIAIALMSVIGFALQLYLSALVMRLTIHRFH